MSIGALAKRALRARARYLKVNLARRNRYLQLGGTEIESLDLEEKSDSLYIGLFLLTHLLWFVSTDGRLRLAYCLRQTCT